MSKGDFHTMKDLVNSLQASMDQLERGELGLTQLDELCDEAREIYERLIVLRYKSMEDTAHPEPEERKPFTLSTTDISPNQTSLIDAIAEIRREEIPEQIELDLGDLEPIPAKEEASEIDSETEEIEEDVQEEVQEEQIVRVDFSEVEEESEEELEEEPVNEAVQKEEIEVEEAPQGETEEVSEEQTVNDLFGADGEITLAEKLGMTPIADLKKAIALNQKFLFINELFDGQESAYQTAVGEINSFGTLTEAWNYLQLNHKAADWNKEDEAVEQFTELIQRRFMSA